MNVSVYIDDLRTKSSSDRTKAALRLRNDVSSKAREKSEEFDQFMNELNVRIFELLKSTENYEIVAGITAIDQVLNSASLYKIAIY